MFKSRGAGAGAWGRVEVKKNPARHDMNERMGGEDKGKEGEDRREGRGREGPVLHNINVPPSPFERLDRPGSLKHPSKHMNAYSNHNNNIKQTKIHNHSKEEDRRCGRPV